MKFEKFFKTVGTYGEIVEMDNGEKWLVCDGVGMKVPFGVVNLLGVGVASETKKTLVDVLTHTDVDNKVELKRSVIHVPNGKASDIVRVFGNGICHDVGVWNRAYGLLEKKDENLAVVSVDDDDLNEHHFLLVCDYDNEVVGFIEGHLEA